MGVALTPEVKSDLIQLFDANAPIPKILERAESSIAAAVRGPIRAETLIRAALLQISMTPALQKCDKLSVVQAVMQAASLGLMVGGPAGEAALVPRKGKACLTPMVRGLVTLAIRSGTVLAVSPVTVIKQDRFKVFRGSGARIEHEPDLDADDRALDAAILYVYAVFQMAGGVEHFDVMNRKEVERIRAVSADGQSADSPWTRWWGEKAKVTVVKRASKMVPMSPEFRAAVELDDRLETGEINQPSELLDSSNDITQHVKTQTVARTEALRYRVAGQKPTATATAQPAPVPAATADARSEAEPQFVIGKKKCPLCGALPGTRHKRGCPNGE